MCRRAIGWKRFSFKKSYRFWPSISNTRQACPRCRKHSNAHTTLNAPAFSWRSLSRIETSIWPWRVYEGWFFSILTATTSLLPWRQHFTTWPNVPFPRNSSTCACHITVNFYGTFTSIYRQSFQPIYWCCPRKNAADLWNKFDTNAPGRLAENSNEWLVSFTLPGFFKSLNFFTDSSCSLWEVIMTNLVALSMWMFINRQSNKEIKIYTR